MDGTSAEQLDASAAPLLAQISGAALLLPLASLSTVFNMLYTFAVCTKITFIMFLSLAAISYISGFLGSYKPLLGIHLYILSPSLKTCLYLGR